MMMMMMMMMLMMLLREFRDEDCEEVKMGSESKIRRRE
jgi:hypothetical protein